MARKLFFAAFVIDEESYTPEPGPVDRHFVCSDLAQSSFGEQPGISGFIVWDAIEALIAEHSQRGPITVEYLSNDEAPTQETFAHAQDTCPSAHWNRGDDICADCGVDLNSSEPDGSASTSHAIATPSFRNELSAPMRDALAFEYYEVRPCIEQDGRINSYADEDDYADGLVAAQDSGQEFRTFWSLYGLDAGAHTAIGDFVSKDAAHEIMNAILAVPAAARNSIISGQPSARTKQFMMESAAGQAANWLDDMINQSSNAQRI